MTLCSSDYCQGVRVTWLVCSRSWLMLERSSGLRLLHTTIHNVVQTWWQTNGHFRLIRRTKAPLPLVKLSLSISTQCKLNDTYPKASTHLDQLESIRLSKVPNLFSTGGFAHVYLVRTPTPVYNTTHHVLKRIQVSDESMLTEVRKEVDVMVRS